MLGRRFVALQEAISPSIRNPLDDTEADVEVGDTSVRVTLLVDGAVAAHAAGEVFDGVGAGRAVMCEDGDEWGVTVSAWQLTADEARCVYRAYIPAEDGSVDTDAVARTITGIEPATEVARLFGGCQMVCVSPVLISERKIYEHGVRRQAAGQRRPPAAA